MLHIGLQHNYFSVALAVCIFKVSKFDGNCRYSELLERVLKELFVLSRCRVAKLRHFALQFAPSLVYVDLLSLAVGDHKVTLSFKNFT